MLSHSLFNLRSVGVLNTTIRSFSSNTSLLKLNDLQHVPGSVKNRKRWARGTGSGRGKMSGHGHQKSRVTPRGFEGGQTPYYKTIPKFGFTNVK